MEVPVHPVVHWIGVGGMAAGAAAIGALTLKSRREDVSHGILHLFVCLVGLFAYVSFVVDRTAVHVDGRSFYVSHYVSWILTFPMIVVAIAMVGLPPLQNVIERRLRASILGGLAGASILWTSGVLFQAFARTGAERWAWFGLSLAAGVATVWQLWRPVLHQVEIKGGRNIREYGILAACFTALAIAYEAVWLVGEPGLLLISTQVENTLLLVLDLASDAGLGILSVLLIERLVHEVEPEPGETAVAASAAHAHAP